MCSASRSARRPTASRGAPLRSTPTTPVPARPVCTSSPNERSLSATNALVAFSSNAVSGCAWMWWRQRAHVGVERGDFGDEVHERSIAPAHGPAAIVAASGRIPGPSMACVPPTISSSSAAASTAPASRAMPRGAGCRCCWSSRTTSPRATSQWSTKLIHGGLRYLEYYEFRLVARGARRARGDAAHRAAPRRAARVRAAARAAPAARVDDPHRACSSTTTWAAAKTLPRSFGVDLAEQPLGGRTEAALPQGLRVRRCARRRRAARRRQRARREGARRGHPRAHEARRRRGATAGCGARR